MVDHGSSTEAPTRPTSTPLSERALAIITSMAALPILWLGYGTDLDVEGVLLAGEGIRAFDYVPSRPPGVPVFEAIVAILHPIGGHLAINLATAVALSATVVGAARIIRTYHRPNGDLIALAFLACPVTVIAGTSTVDFIWALAFFVWAVVAHRADRTVAAGVLFALAIGSRGSTAVLVLAFILAEGWDPARRRRSFTTAAVACSLGVMLYVPSWLAYDRTSGFLDTTDGWQSWSNNLGRALVKNYATAGVLAMVVLAVAVPALLRTLRTWDTDPLVRMAALGFVVTQALFVTVPWKLAHLLPSLLMLLLWMAATEWNRRPYLWVLITALGINGAVGFRPVVPDEPDASRSAVFAPTLTLGLLAQDVRCRAKFMHEPPQLESGAWPCTLETLRGPLDPGAGSD